MKVSVVVATRDAERTLERCLRSVRSQTFSPLEIVVVDNGSTDTTVGIAGVFADVVVAAGPERSTQRNIGALQSTGDVVMFVDADMVLEPGVVGEAVGCLTDPGTAAVVVPEHSFGDGFWARCKAMEKEVALGDPAVEAARVFRRRDFEAVRGYDESLVACEDWDLADRVVERAGGTPARTRSRIWHDEGRLRLGSTFSKKRYYGRWVSQWLTTAPAHRRRRGIGSHLPRLARRPLTAGGLLTMKVVETAGFALGMRDARRSVEGPDGPVPATDRGAVRIAALISAVIGVAAVQSWFTPGAFVAAGDNGPWMRGLGSVTRAWSDALAGTGSTAYPSASLVESFLHDVVVAVGLSDTLGQRIWYSLVVAVTALAVCWLTATAVRRPAALVAAGLVAVLAPFHITTLPNVLPLIAVGVVSLLIGLGVRVANGTSNSVSAAAPFAVATAVWMAPLAKNPPLLALVVVCVAIVAVSMIARPHDVTRPPRRAVVLRLAGVVGWFALASAFWAVPLVIHYALGTPGLHIVAEIDVDAWSWTQRNSGPSNVVTLVASWVWGAPDILPATATLATSPWSWLRWALPIGAFAALPLAMHRRLALWLGGAAALFVVLATGVNEPFAPINRFLLEHVPGFWLFRQPMSKFGIVLVVVDALLVALAVDGLAARRPTWRPVPRRASATAAAVLAVSFLAFSHPLYTGSVIPGQRAGADGLPPARVTVPSSWYDAGRWLDEAPLPGSVVVLPLADYYQRGTTWGYYGVDDLMWRVSERPGLFLLPGGYYEPAGATPQLLTALEASLASGDDDAVVRLMDALGASYLAIRTDLATTANRTFIDPDSLISAADRAHELHAERAFEHVRFYSAPPVPSGATMVDVASGTSAEELADIIAAAPRGTLIVDDDGLPGAAAAWRPSGGDTQRDVDLTAGSHRLTAHTRNAPLWRAEVTDTADGRFEVAVTLASTISVDGVPVTPAGRVTLPTSAPPSALLVDDRVIPLDGWPTLFEATPGSKISLLGDGTAAGLNPADLQLGNCNNVERNTLDEAGITAVPTLGGVVLRAESGSACVSVDAPTATAVVDGHGALWHVRTEFDRSSGTATRVCLWLPAAERCAPGTPPGTTDGTGRFDFIAGAGPADPDTDARLVLYADHTDDIEVASARFSSVSVAPVQLVGGPVELPATTTDGVTRELPGGTTRLTTDPVLAGDLAEPLSSEVGDCHDYDDAATGIEARSLDGGAGSSVRLTAVRHSACVDAAVPVPAGLRHLTVTFEHRTVSGSGGRWCLMAPGGTCVAGGGLPAASDWTEMSAEVVLASTDPFTRDGEGDFHLYLYADGAGPTQPSTDPTVTEYRDVAVRLTSPVVAVVQPVRPVLESSTSTARRDARVAAGTTALVRFDQAFAPGWSVDGLPADASVTHLMVDGWANGWIVTGLEQPADIHFTFGPDRWAGIAVWGLVPVVAAVALLSIRRRRAGRTTT